MELAKEFDGLVPVTSRGEHRSLAAELARKGDGRACGPRQVLKSHALLLSRLHEAREEEIGRVGVRFLRPGVPPEKSSSTVLGVKAPKSVPSRRTLHVRKEPTQEIDEPLFLRGQPTAECQFTLSFQENAGYKVWVPCVVAEATMSALVKLETEIDESAGYAGPLSTASRPRNAVGGVSQEIAGYLVRSMCLFTHSSQPGGTERRRQDDVNYGEARAGDCCCALMSSVTAWCPPLSATSAVLLVVARTRRQLL